ncbi:arylsulfatase [Stieleria sp. JC731]|nr:arylsulfatase [Stieleria sp. JC731]MCC9603085.1 arylsulfatase [Stieleria sp. JC731]
MKLQPNVLSFLLLILSIASSDRCLADDRPNIVVIVCDDMGFSDLGCYGGEIDTPNLDRLAKSGLRLTDFHNNAKCSETRASLLTGLWHQQSKNLKKPGHVTLAEVLRQSGYTTMMSGKWHLDGHPLDRGFDRYFGFLSGAINFFTGKDWGNGKNLMRLDREVFEAPDDFYSTDAFTDYAIEFLEQARQKDQSYFLYLAHNAPHFPLHAPETEIEKYRGRYDIGWDKIRQQRFARQKELGLIDPTWSLTERDPKVEPFDKLSDSQKRFLIPMMEVYAAMVDRLDQNVGRLVDNLKQNGELDNTLILFFSDNGACPYNRLRSDNIPPGPAESDYAYDARWANMCNTPLRLYKQYAHEGGTLSPMIIHWPKQLAGAGTVSKATHHIVDLMPTFVELSGGKYPDKFAGKAIQSMEGVSMVSTITGQEQSSRPPIFWEFSSNHSVRDGKWKLVAERSKDWELYDLSNDKTETVNLADRQPEIVTRLSEKYDAWAMRVGAKTHQASLNTKPSKQSQLFDLPSR